MSLRCIRCTFRFKVYQQKSVVLIGTSRFLPDVCIYQFEIILLEIQSKKTVDLDKSIFDTYFIWINNSEEKKEIYLKDSSNFTLNLSHH